ncbi:MAG: hypothetical protein M3Q42_13175 [Pseudomonadota bacterium]|nr:hypothetical protein [Pseudomonadota bacterium]
MRIDNFEPLWLDPQGRCIYAALHTVLDRARTGVVMVPPMLHELATSRRFVAEISAVLADQGIPSLRFDFFGTGDSCGRGDQLDFGSIATDLELAVATLCKRTGVERVVLLVWRGAALPVGRWLERGGRADLVVLWEPITDGAAWLRELELADAQERATRPGPRPGARCVAADPADGQLMGFAASSRLRMELGQSCLENHLLWGSAPVWVIGRGELAELQPGVTRVLPLPPAAPTFGGGAAMDKTFFLTPAVRKMVDQLGRSLQESTWK